MDYCVSVCETERNVPDLFILLCQFPQLLIGTPEDTLRAKLQALVYDILPSTTAVFSYAIASMKKVNQRAVFC